MYSIRRVENTDEARIERTEQAKSYDKIMYKNVTKLMYRKPDNSIERCWIGEGNRPDGKHADQVFIMNENGKTIETI